MVEIGSDNHSYSPKSARVESTWVLRLENELGRFKAELCLAIRQDVCLNLVGQYCSHTARSTPISHRREPHFRPTAVLLSLFLRGLEEILFELVITLKDKRLAEVPAPWRSSQVKINSACGQGFRGPLSKKRSLRGGQVVMANQKLLERFPLGHRLCVTDLRTKKYCLNPLPEFILLQTVESLHQDHFQHCHFQHCTDQLLNGLVRATNPFSASSQSLPPKSSAQSVQHNRLRKWNLQQQFRDRSTPPPAPVLEA